MELRVRLPWENLNMSMPPDNVYRQPPSLRLGYEFQFSDGMFNLFEDVRENKQTRMFHKDESKKIHFFGNNPLYSQKIA